MASSTIHTLYLLASYLVGSLLISYYMGKWLDVDLFREGSKNPGAANLTRLVSWQAGLVGFLGDALKGFLVVFMAVHFDMPTYIVYLSGVCVVLGHVMSVFHKFRGGVGLATATGWLVAFLLVDVPYRWLTVAVLALFVIIGKIVGRYGSIDFIEHLKVT